ncbi:Nn.00g092050.m01.CDS01 [Neocucurbitaria sp. VM-36]
MSYADYGYHHDSRHHQRPRHDFYYTPSRDSDVYSYSRHAQPSSAAREKLTNMRSAPPPLLPRRFAAPAQHRRPAREQTWPPSPSVEDETAGVEGADDGEPPANTRGTVDQETLLDEIEQPTNAYASHDRRFVLVSEPGTDDESRSKYPPSRDRRRKSFAERGNMPHIKTHVEEPPVFMERVSTPYAYTKPQKESTAPSPGAFIRSPEPLTPSDSSISPSVPRNDPRDEQKEQNAKPAKPRPTPSPHNSFSKTRQTRNMDVFDDSDMEFEDTTRLRTERKPARYSFVKNDLHKEDLRTNLRDDQPRPEPRRRESGQQRPPTLRGGDSKGSSKDTSYPQSPRSSSSSLNSGNRVPRSVPVDAGLSSSTRTPSRPSSPLQRVPSPKLPPRLRESPPSSRPSSSRGNNTRPASPLSFSTTVRPPSPSRVPVTQADWHSTYPPVSANDRSRPPSRYGRHETMPIPMPRIDVQSPSPSRPPPADSFLPYPVDDRPSEVFMPPEEQYQFDHSTIASPRQAYPDSPRVSSSTIPGSPRVKEAVFRPSQQDTATSEEPMRTRRTRSNSVRSQSSQDGRRVQPVKKTAALDLQKPLPSCPRSVPSSRYDDWFSLQGYSSFDICPSCYEDVFADTPFAVHFSQIRLYQRPMERVCDFSSPWMRLAWLLTIKQRRQSLDLLYALADVADEERPCPGDRELGTDRVAWYGLPDQRDGVHVANFAICSCDKKMIEILFPSMRGYFTKMPSNYQSSISRFMCSLRTSSRRFPKYLDLLVELDAEAQSLGQQPNIHRFVQLARENAFKGECGKDKTSTRKPWHFIPSLPEFTVCEECYDELVWPATQSKSVPPTIPRLFNKTIQLVPSEDPECGSSCCLYSPRMRRVWDTSVKEEDFSYLKRKALERKKAEMRLARERKGIVSWMVGAERGSSQWERAKNELKGLEKEWAAWE